MIKSSEIKQIARNKLAGNWIKAFAITIIFVAITLALSYCSLLIRNLTTNTPILYYASQIIFTLITLTLSFGFISTMIKLLNGKNPPYTTVINDALLNSSKAIGLFFRIILKMLIPCIVVILAFIAIFFLTTQVIPLNVDTLGGYLLLLFLFYIFAITIIIIFSLPYTLSSYALANENNLSSKEAIEKSISLMDGNKWNFVKLILSFLGWFILIAVVTVAIQSFTPEVLNDLIESIGTILILPYIISSISIFYDELNDVTVEVVNTDKTENKEELNENTETNSENNSKE